MFNDTLANVKPTCLLLTTVLNCTISAILAWRFVFKSFYQEFIKSHFSLYCLKQFLFSFAQLAQIFFSFSFNFSST